MIKSYLKNDVDRNYANIYYSEKFILYPYCNGSLCHSSNQENYIGKIFAKNL